MVVDEISYGLTYSRDPRPVLEISDDPLVWNSFIMYFDMTGRRVRCLVAPLSMVALFGRPAQSHLDAGAVYGARIVQRRI
jgi:hypothetical protein